MLKPANQTEQEIAPDLPAEARTPHLSLVQDEHGEAWALAAEPAPFEPGDYPYRDRLSRSAYQRQLRELQVELIKLQSWIKLTGQRVVILFEGRDAAGKGGTIKRFAEHLNPRHARIVSLDKPSETERGQWYFQRYIEQLPTRGELVLFDRSWYNRAGVEHVMGFCSEQEYQAFFPQTIDLEHNLIDSGILMFKLWFDVSRAEQKRRMMARSSDPLKRWKLSPVDLQALEKWDQYSEAEQTIFQRTATAQSPWVCIKSDCKRRARLQAMRHTLSRIEYDGKQAAALEPIDELILSVRAGD